MKRWIIRAVAIGALAAGVAATAALAVTPVSGGDAGGTTITVNNGPGDQTDLHVSGDLVAYTDLSLGGQIHYFNFGTSVDLAVPNPAGAVGSLSDVSGSRIAFVRTNLGVRATMVFDVASATLVEIDPPAAYDPFGTAIAGNTVVFEDAGSGNGDIDVADVGAPTAPLQNISASPEFDGYPQVAPNGDLVVWERCDAAFFCDVYQSTRSGGAWGAPTAVAATSDNEQFADTDGKTIVYAAEAGTDWDIYLKPVSGGPAVRLQMPGSQLVPRISGGVISFESAQPGPQTDIFVYVLATNTMFRVTDTPGVNEDLNDVSVLPNGDVRVVWEASDDLVFDHNIYARTFTVPLPDIAVAPADVDFGDVNVGTTGSTIVTVSNVGDAPLSVSGVGLSPTGGPFAITTPPALPATVAPGGTLDVPLAFSPTATGVRSETLTLTSNDPDEGTVQVPLTGRGVVSQPPPSQQIANILAFFDSSVAAGTLQGSGPGNSAQGRLRALRNMIEAAGDLIRRGLIADACGQLADARNRTDGQPQPPDFVSGPAAVELRTRIETLRATLGCT